MGPADGAAERYMAMNSHVDKKNHGPSYIGVLGDYTGGKLWIYDENGSPRAHLVPMKREFELQERAAATSGSFTTRVLPGFTTRILPGLFVRRR